MNLDQTKREAIKWLKVLEDMTARDYQEKKGIVDIIEGLEAELKGNLHGPEWWKERAKAVSFHAEYASAQSFAASAAAP